MKNLLQFPFFLYCRFKTKTRFVYLLAACLTAFPTGLLNPASAQLAKGSDKFFGSIHKHHQSEELFFTTYFNQITPENSGKWGKVEYVRDQMNWHYLDHIYDFAAENNLQMKQHTFVWDLSQPAWLSSLSHEEIREEVEEWIALFVERYPNIEYIEPANEPTRNAPPYKEALGGDGETGYDWVIWVFEKVKQYAPDAKLILNDYDVLKNNNVREELITIANLLKEQDLIDAIGCQGHFLEGQSANGIQNALDQIAETGLDIYITEFDLGIANDTQQLNKYQELFPVIWEHTSVKGVTLWGHYENETWRENAHLIRDDGSHRPAMNWLIDYITSTTPHPFAEIISPAMNQKFSTTEIIEFSVRAFDHQGSVDKVELFLNEELIGIADLETEDIYTFGIQDIEAGTHEVFARATDNEDYQYDSGIFYLFVVDENTLSPIDDSFARSDKPDDIFGINDRPELNLRWRANQASLRYSYLKFQIPENIEITALTRATLELYSYKYDSPNPIQIEVLLAENDWDEDLLTWNNKPVFLEEHGIITLDYPYLNAEEGIWSVDILPLLENYSDNTFTVSLRIKEFVDGGNMIKFRTKESAYAIRHPRFIYDYDQQSDAGNQYAGNLNTVLFPNPLTDHSLRITSEKVFEKVKIFSVDGKMVFIADYPADTHTANLDLSQLNQGVYLCRIQLTNGNWENHKLIKQF